MECLGKKNTIMKKIVSTQNPAVLTGTTVTAFCKADITDGVSIETYEAERTIEVSENFDFRLVDQVSQALLEEWLTPLLEA